MSVVQVPNGSLRVRPRFVVVRTGVFLCILLKDCRRPRARCSRSNQNDGKPHKEPGFLQPRHPRCPWLSDSSRASAHRPWSGQSYLFPGPVPRCLGSAPFGVGTAGIPANICRGHVAAQSPRLPYPAPAWWMFSTRPATRIQGGLAKVGICRQPPDGRTATETVAPLVERPRSQHRFKAPDSTRMAANGSSVSALSSSAPTTITRRDGQAGFRRAHTPARGSTRRTRKRSRTPRR